ncbi:13208_t:CDS:2, partial [Racocetra fulgida]
WARPEKALTEKQIRKLQRREAREKEGQDLKCFPKIDLPFSSHFYFPDHEIPIARIIGEKDEFLDPIRVQTKCYMWYEPQNHMVRVIGDDEDNAYEAISRVKNLYLKVFLARSIPVKRGWVYHMIEQPRMPYKVRITDPPSLFIPPYDMVGFFKVFEPVIEEEQSPTDTKIEIFESEFNAKFIAIHYFNQLKNLEEYFSNNQVWDDSSFHEFKIRASRRPVRFDEQRWTCAFDVSFRNGKIGLWNAVADEKNVLEINMAICEKHKKKFLWKEHFIIEITRYEYWNCEGKFLNVSPGVEIPLQREPSENVSFGITKSWEDDFSANGNLNSGEVPEWYPEDISSGVKQMLNDINEFLKILQDSNVIQPNVLKCESLK